ncbi:MAG: tRNA (adenosine(37)-N6)-threonylcarbamoyltransferase complex transferase subunit TsaD [Bacteroidales bacterium]|nr:tRNA (adenosine(37)-N6)-threonylcarbamoyltransferase complex transferase subunit TsaD [Bacteroidales bacterium]
MVTTILGIESSCDDTSASVIRDGYMLSNVIANQEVHKAYGGVVPELASRAHQQNIIPVVDRALRLAGVDKSEIDGLAFTRGPGLLGSLLVGTSFAKGFALYNNIPLIEVNHLQAHVLAHFIKEKDTDNQQPDFPFLCLLVSGGHTQIILVKNYFDMEIIGQTIDDAAGEAFDKCAKTMGLPYPGGPWVDKYAKEGNPQAYKFTKPRIANLDYSYSGFKTAFLYFIRDNIKEHPDFIKENMNDLCASIQFTIIDILIDKLKLAIKQTDVNQVAIAGGVSANSGLRNAITQLGQELNLKVFIPEFKFTTDNAAMIAIAGYYKFLEKEFVGQEVIPLARMPF